MSLTSSESRAPRRPSLLRSVVPITLFMLVCGVVGPIFLVMGLVIDDPEAGWLLPTGIGVTALDIIIGVLIGLGRYRSQQRTYRLHQRGRRAVADVLDVASTSVTINDQPLMRLTLRIHGDDVPTLEVQKKQVVSHAQLPLLSASQVPVLVDPETQEWEIDWAAARAARPPTGATGAFSPPPDDRPAADRLAELDELLRKDLISRDEYDATRARILGGI